MEPVKTKEEVKVNPLLDWITNFETKVTTVEQKVGLVNKSITDTGNDLRTAFGRAKRGLETMIEEKAIKDDKSITDLIELINSKEYQPEINVDSGVKELRDEMLGLLHDLKDAIMMKKTWVHTVERDKNELIKTITSVNQ